MYRIFGGMPVAAGQAPESFPIDTNYVMTAVFSLRVQMLECNLFSGCNINIAVLLLSNRHNCQIRAVLGV